MIKVGSIVRSVLNSNRRGAVTSVRFPPWSDRLIVNVCWDDGGFSSYYAKDLIVLNNYKWRKL